MWKFNLVVFGAYKTVQSLMYVQRGWSLTNTGLVKMCCGEVTRRSTWEINVLCLGCTGLHGCARQCSRIYMDLGNQRRFNICWGSFTGGKGGGISSFMTVMKTVSTFSFSCGNFFCFNSDQGSFGLLCFEKEYSICETSLR